MTTRGTQTLTWDIDNRVSSISIQGGGTTYMHYDYTGMRIQKDAPGGTSLYPFRGYEKDSSGTVTKYIRIGVEIFASKRTTSGGASTQYFYHNDHLGSVNVVTDSNGYQVQLNEYDPWGNVSKSTSTTEATHRFTGQELDPESSIYYYGGRCYDQVISRFASPDPFVQSPDEPQNLDRYSYTFNNPQNYIDPSGYDAGDSGGYTIPVYGWIQFFMNLSKHKKHVFVPRFNRTVPPFDETRVRAGVVNPGGQMPNVDAYNVDPQNAGLGIQLAQASPGNGGTLSDATTDLGVRARPPWMDEAGLQKPTIDPVDLLLGIGSIARIALKQAAKIGTTTLWRAVGPRELVQTIVSGLVNLLNDHFIC